MATYMDELTKRFATDSDAIEWARQCVQPVIDGWRRDAARHAANGAHHTADEYGRMATRMEIDLLGGSSPIIAPFDTRRPELLETVSEDTVSSYLVRKRDGGWRLKRWEASGESTGPGIGF